MSRHARRHRIYRCSCYWQCLAPLYGGICHPLLPFCSTLSASYRRVVSGWSGAVTGSHAQNAPQIPLRIYAWRNWLYFHLHLLIFFRSSPRPRSRSRLDRYLWPLLICYFLGPTASEGARARASVFWRGAGFAGCRPFGYSGGTTV